MTNGGGRFAPALKSKDPGPEDPALTSPQRGFERGNFYQQVSGVRFQVSATEVDPLDESRS